MRKLISFVFVLIPIVLLGCSKEFEETGQTQIFSFPAGSNFSLSPSYSDYWKGPNGEEGFATLDINDAKLFWFDVKMAKEPKVLVDFGDLRSSITGVEIINKDSILYASGDLNSVVLINGEGAELGRWSLKPFQPTFKKEAKVTDCFINVMDFSPLLYPCKDRIYLPFFPSVDSDEIEQMFKSKALLEFSLQGKAHENRLLVRYPTSYRSGKNYFGRLGSIFSYCINKQDEVVASFPGDPCLYVYDRKTGEFQKKEIAKSKYITSISPYAGSKSEPKEIRNYTLKAPSYYKLMYDAANGLYYRICLHAQELYADPQKTKLKKFEDKPWSLMVLNEEFETLKEVYFAPKSHQFRNVLVANDQLWVGKTPNEDQQKKRQLVYTTYQYQ